MLLMAFIWIVRSNISSIVVLEGEYLSLCGYCLVLTFSSVALMLFFTLFFLSSGQFLWYWLKQLCLWLCQPLIICFVVASWFWDRHWLYTMSRSLAASIYWVSLWFMRFSRCLSYLSTTLAVHSDSIGSFWNPLFATRKVWVYNLQSDTIFECTTYLRPPHLCQVCSMFPKRAPKTQAFSGDSGAGSPKKLFGFLLLKIPFPELPSYSDGILARFQLEKCFYF